MKKLGMAFYFLVSLSVGWLLAQGPEGGGPEEQMGQPPGEMMRHPEDIVLDYRGLIQQIDQMRRHEEEVLRKLEDLSRGYEDGLKRLEETSKRLEDQLKEFKEWYDKAVDKMEAIDRAWTQPSPIKGEIRGAPSDRYTTN